MIETHFIEHVAAGFWKSQHYLDEIPVATGFWWVYTAPLLTDYMVFCQIKAEWEFKCGFKKYFAHLWNIFSCGAHGRYVHVEDEIELEWSGCE